MKKEKFIIFEFMTGKLGLSGNELVAYAFLYDATGGGKKQYEGGQGEIAENIGVAVPTVYNILGKMEARGLIERQDGTKTGAIRLTRVK